MSIFSRIFAGPDTIKTTVEAVRDSLDALVYTSEEKEQAAAANRAEARGMVVNWMTATSGQNLARRWLAVVITSTWLGQYLVAQAFAIASIWIDIGRRIAWREASELMAGYAEQMNGAVMLILGFYFAAPHLDRIVDSAMAKFGKRQPLPKEIDQ
jgi:hypothetical protein